MIALFGSIGIGLVWGWLLVLLCGRCRPQRPLLAFLLITGATALIFLQVFLFTDWRASLYFVGALALALFAHLGWRENLRKRASSSSQSS